MVGGQWIPVLGSTARALLPALMAGLPRQKGNGLGRPAIVTRCQARVSDADLVAVGPVKPTGAAGTDQVEGAGRVDRAGDVIGRSAAAGPTRVEGNDRVLESNVPATTSSPPPVPPLAMSFSAMVLLTSVRLPPPAKSAAVRTACKPRDCLATRCRRQRATRASAAPGPS